MEEINEDKITTIKVRASTAKKLQEWKMQLGCISVEEVLKRILAIVPASELGTWKWVKDNESK